MGRDPTRFLAERYLPQSGAAGAGESVRRLEAAAAELSDEGTVVRHLRAIFVPADETCFHLFEAASPELVAEAGERAEVPLLRIAPAVEVDAADPVATIASATRGGAAR